MISSTPDAGVDSVGETDTERGELRGPWIAAWGDVLLRWEAREGRQRIVIRSFKEALLWSRQPAQWLPGPRLRHPGGDDVAGHPQAPGGQLLPRLAAHRPPAGRAGHGGGGGAWAMASPTGPRATRDRRFPTAAHPASRHPLQSAA